MSSFISARSCRYHNAGYCWRGSTCGFYHSEPMNTSNRQTIHHLPIKPPPLPPIEDHDDKSLEIPIASTSTSKASNKSKQSKDLPERNPDETCGICLDYPQTYYGLLSSCSHVFCLPCIRNWRTHKGKSSDQVSMGILRRCPLCRIESAYLVQSVTFYPNGSKEKDLIVKSTREKWSEKTCRNFSRFGNCCFGKECFYKHVNYDGQIVELPHTHQEWLNTRSEPDFPGLSLVQRATGNGLEPMHMLARLLTNQPSVRDYLVRVTGSTVEEVDLLLRRFVSDQPLERPILFGHRTSRVAGERDTDQREGQDASIQNPMSHEAIIAHTVEQIDVIQSGAGQSSDGETRSADTNVRDSNQHIDPRITSDVEPRSELESVRSEEVHQNLAGREVQYNTALREVASENCDDILDQRPTPGPSVPIENTNNVERDQISSSDSIESTREPSTHGMVLTTDLNDDTVPLDIPQTTSEPSNRATVIPSNEPSTSTQLEATITQVPTTTQSDASTTPQAQSSPQANSTTTPPTTGASTNSSTNLIPPVNQPTSQSLGNEESSSIPLSQNVAPLARAILGPNLQRVADEVERQIMELVMDFLSLDESVELGRLATGWMRGIIGSN
ncbi:hypothetical protein DFH28DRAFT_503439 [Melampsora americana]|nr:hypothetical protein DFH28DRAFT_503439 [Melampsora americana]